MEKILSRESALFFPAQWVLEASASGTWRAQCDGMLALLVRLNLPGNCLAMPSAN